MALIEFFPIIPRFFTDERLYKLDSDHKIIFAYASFGLQSAAQGKIGIHRVSRGELATGANIDMAKTEKIVDYFNKELPDLMRWDEETHMIFLPSKLKYLIRHGYLKGRFIFAEIHKDFKKYGDKVPEFWSDFVKLYHKDIQESFDKISEKDNNYKNYSETLAKLFEKKPSSKISKSSSTNLTENELEIFI